MNLTTAISFPAMFKGLPVTVRSHPVMFNAHLATDISHLATVRGRPAMFNGLPVAEIGHLVMFNALPGMNKQAGNASQKILI